MRGSSGRLYPTQWFDNGELVYQAELAGTPYVVDLGSRARKSWSNGGGSPKRARRRGATGLQWPGLWVPRRCVVSVIHSHVQRQQRHE